MLVLGNILGQTFNPSMAKVLGDPGRYVSQQAVKKYRRFLLCAFAGGCLVSFLLGMFLMYDLAIPKRSYAVSILLPAIFLLLLIFIDRIVSRKMDAYETERENYLKGATGEHRVAQTINDLPDGFFVIHDLAKPFGNLDHVVIGSTGVFVLETKNWKGVITPDGRGGILHNGHRYLKDVIKPLIVRMMSVRTKINALCDTKTDLPYFNALMVFPSARVDVKWGQTGRARCISDEQLWNCIVEARTDRKLSAAEIDHLAHAFKALVSMDKTFSTTLKT